MQTVAERATRYEQSLFLIQQNVCGKWVTVGNRLTREDAEAAADYWTEETYSEHRVVEISR